MGFHRPVREVHRANVRLIEGGVGPIVAEPEHEVCADDPTRHVAAEHKSQAAEHLAFHHIRSVPEHVPHPRGKLLVVRHGDESRARSGFMSYSAPSTFVTSGGGAG